MLLLSLKVMKMSKANIFQPRKKFEVINAKTGELKQVDYITKGQSDFDEFYIKRKIKFVPVPVQEGSDDYVLELKVIDDKEDIRQVINSQADGVGLQAMIDKFEKTGDPSVLPQPMNPSDDIVDFTKMPQDDAEYFDYIHSLAEQFEKLPIELRKDMDAKTFIQNVTQKQVDDYLKTLMPKEEKKDE